MKGNKTENRHSHDDSYDAVEANDLDSRYRNEFSTSNVCAIFFTIISVTAKINLALADIITLASVKV